MSFVLRAIALFALCVIVGVVLEKFGLPTRGSLAETWHAVYRLFHKLDGLIAWSVPHALLGAVVVGPLLLVVLVDRFRRRRGR